MAEMPSYKNTINYSIANSVMTKMRANGDLKNYGFKTWYVGILERTEKTKYPLFAVWADTVGTVVRSIGPTIEASYRVVIIFAFHAKKTIEDDVAHAEMISAKIASVHLAQMPDNYSNTNIDYIHPLVPITSWYEAQQFPIQKQTLLCWRMITFDVMKRS